jgi:hypothetical protein
MNNSLFIHKSIPCPAWIALSNSISKKKLLAISGKFTFMPEIGKDLTAHTAHGTNFKVPGHAVWTPAASREKVPRRKEAL